MQTTIQYEGDQNMRVLLSTLGVNESLPEIKALLMRIIWGAQPILPSDIISDLLPKEKRENSDLSSLIAKFRDQILALWNEQKHYRDGETPFGFEIFPSASTPEDLITRVRGRVKEVKMLMPLFGEDMSDLEEESCREISNIKLKVIRSLECLTLVLNLLSMAGSNLALSQTEGALADIDTALQSAFNDLGRLLARRETRPTEMFTIAGRHGEA